MSTSDAQRRGRHAKRKGDTYEREIVGVLRDHGWWSAQRNYGQAANGGADVRYAIPDVRIECKRCETFSLPAWWRQVNAACLPSDTPLVVARGNGQPNMGHLRLCDLLAWSAGMAWDALAVGPRASVRSEFMGLVRSGHGHPLVIHQMGADCMAAVLFTDLLATFGDGA